MGVKLIEHCIFNRLQIIYVLRTNCCYDVIGEDTVEFECLKAFPEKGLFVYFLGGTYTTVHHQRKGSLGQRSMKIQQFFFSQISEMLRFSLWNDITFISHIWEIASDKQAKRHRTNSNFLNS